MKILGKLSNTGWALARRIGTYIPFTYWRMVYKGIGRNIESILDVGCADGDMMSFINYRRCYTTIGMDIHQPYLDEARKYRRHGNYIRGSCCALPFASKSFDAVLLLEIIEHLEPADSCQAIEEAERVARKQVIISTPVDFHQQKAYSENPHQEHLSAWTPLQMRERGYKVRGMGILENRLVETVRDTILKTADRRVAKEESAGNVEKQTVTHSFKLVDFLLRLPYYLIPGPLVYFLPRCAGHMICYKEHKGND